MTTLILRLRKLAVSVDAAHLDDRTVPLPATLGADVRALLSELDPVLHEWALRLALHRTVSSASLGAVPPTVRTDADDAVDALVASGILAPDPQWPDMWRCEPLVQRAVEEELRARDPDGSRRSHGAIVAALIEADDPRLEEELLHHARRAGRWDVLAGLWSRRGEALLTSYPAMASWAFSSLPAGVVARNPTLRVAELVAGAASPVTEPQDNMAMLRAIAADARATRQLLPQADDAEAVCAQGWLNLRALAQLGHVVEANEWVDVVEAELTRRGTGLHPPSWRRFAVEAATARLLAGRIPEVRRLATAAIDDGRATDDTIGRTGRGLLALVNAILGWEPTPPPSATGGMCNSRS